MRLRRSFSPSPSSRSRGKGARFRGVGPASVTLAVAASALGSAGCGTAPLRVRGGPDLGVYATSDGDGPDLAGYRFRPSVCDGVDVLPEYGTIDERSLQALLQRARIDVTVERPRSDLTYFVLRAPDLVDPVRLRVATLKSADEAGRSLHDALLEHGPGSWGVHRANLAILGPVASESDAIVFAARTRLACWGTFTVTGTDDVFVVPGGYAEP